MARVLLVKPISQYCYTIAPNLGLGYLASVLRNAGHDVTFLDCDKERLSLEGFADRLKGEVYDVIGFQLYTNGLYTARKQLEIARQRMKEALIIVGGPHATGDPHQTLAFLKDADLAVLGEGENIIDKIAGLKRSDVKDTSVLANLSNIAYRNAAGAVCVNPIRNIGDLDSLPMPAWELMDPRRYPEAPHGTFARSFPIAPIITSRGCPYSCTFCASFRIHGRKMRRRSSAAVLDEIEYLNKKFGVREFQIEDDNFTMGKEYAREVLSGIIERGLRVWISLPNGVRIDALDKELLQLMERAGCYSLAIGIESGSDRILKKLQKSLTTKEIEEKLNLVKKHTKIRVTGFFLIGHPDETEDDIKKSIEFALRLKLDRASFSPLMPLPGSAIYDEWKGRVDFENVDWNKFLYYQFIPSVSPLPVDMLERCLKSANARFYIRPHIWLGLLVEVRTPYQFKMLLKRARKILVG
ncbi:MAG: radical SAM protein [Candidatus Omnitrophica bacterium]|nr:radical SAM protein [Candidatus Omnitrophota bacterium]